MNPSNIVRVFRFETLERSTFGKNAIAVSSSSTPLNDCGNFSVGRLPIKERFSDYGSKYLLAIERGDPI